MNRLFIVFLMLVIWAGFSIAQQIPGAAPGVTANHLETPPAAMFSPVQWQRSAADQSSFVYATTTYTFNDIVVFSYFDQSNFFIFNTDGSAVDSVQLDENKYYVFKPGAGIWRVEGNKSFTLLIGDPISRSVMGYYAIDESGRPVSTRLNTFMPAHNYSGEHFIVTAYHPGTEFTIRDLDSGATIAAGILNEGEHFELNNYYYAFLGVYASKPVSALSYTDQGYAVPSTNGTFAGTHFYGFAGYVGYWPNGMIVTAYEDTTHYAVINSTTGDTISSGLLNKGMATTDYSTGDTYFEVIADKNVTVNNTPFAYYSGAYYYLSLQIDETGRGVGTNFYTPTIYGDMNIFSYEDGNVITVFNTWSQAEVWSDTLNAGEYQYLNSEKTVYHITGTENLAVITSNGGSFGAEFMPVNYALGLPDLSISADDIFFEPDSAERNPGEPITLKATVHNFGPVTAYQVGLKFFDGEPDADLPISKTMYIDSLPPNNSHTFAMGWIVPENPAYHAVYAQADPTNVVTESNNSNNTAFKFIVPNDDLYPPLSISITQPKSIQAQNGSPLDSIIQITVDVFNTGNVDANNSFILIKLPAGWELFNEDDSTWIALYTIPPQESVSYTWMVRVNELPDGNAYFYSIDADADETPLKTVERMIPVDDIDVHAILTSSAIPELFRLKQNYPNPFNPLTTIEFDVAESGNVLIDVYSISGRKVASLVDGPFHPGSYKQVFHAGDLSSGIYFIRYNFNGRLVSIRKTMLVK
jgi:hypothetical protein